MKELLFDSKSLIKYQTIGRNLVAVLFLALTLLFIFDSELAERLTFWAVAILLLAAFGRLAIFIVQFQRARLYRFSLLSYLLGFLLLSTVILKFWIL